MPLGRQEARAHEQLFRRERSTGPRAPRPNADPRPSPRRPRGRPVRHEAALASFDLRQPSRRDQPAEACHRLGGLDPASRGAARPCSARADLRRRTSAGLNKGEARNALARAIFFHRLGEIRDRTLAKLASAAAPTQSASGIDMDADGEIGRRVPPQAANPSSVAKRAVRRQTRSPLPGRAGDELPPGDEPPSGVSGIGARARWRWNALRRRASSSARPARRTFAAAALSAKRWRQRPAQGSVP